ncbi:MULTISPECIES: CU044_5270 family protein [unclassified Streptomyces]|uniref:CU044_5270 family protein n=1 Tax=unclassified Streptomyces TaxID=2593676 RepID=UPI0033255219
MADELDLLRTADPVPAGGPHYGDGPLDHTAERHLARLLHDTPRARRWTGPRLVWSLAAALAAVATTLTVLLGGPGGTPAVAAPRPLAVRAHSTPVPLTDVADLAAVAARDGSPALRRGTHVQSWSLGTSDDRPPVTLPEERVERWAADGTHTEVVVATDPSHPGRPVLTDEGDRPRRVEDGHVLSRRSFPPMWGDAPPYATPPHTPAKLRSYLTELIYSHTRTLSTAQLLDATRELLDNWTLGARESAALADLLADAQGLRPAGQVTDRLGRTGQAYVHDDASGARQMLILDPSTGAVLGLEMTSTRNDPEYGVRAGDVMEYSAWMR